MNRIAALCAVAGLAVSALAGPAFGHNPPFAGQNPPFAGGSPNAKDPEVDKLAAAAAKLEKQSKAKPKDEKLKLKVADAYYQAGHTMMTSPKLASKVKYRGALMHFRTALKYNPKHEKAASEKKMIEDIYKSMGRPIPG